MRRSKNGASFTGSLFYAVLAALASIPEPMIEIWVRDLVDTDETLGNRAASRMESRTVGSSGLFTDPAWCNSCRAMKVPSHSMLP